MLSNGGHGGGVCIYVKCNLTNKIREDLSFDELEYLTGIEINKPRSRPLLISTWYRPPDSPTCHFDYFEKIMKKVDLTSYEYFLLGDISVDLMPGGTSVNATKLAFLTLCDQAFNPPFLGGKIIELSKFCFMNKRFETSLSFFCKPVLSLSLYEVSIPNFKFSPRKYAMKKCIFSASIYIRKLLSLIQNFNNFGITKGLTIV